MTTVLLTPSEFETAIRAVGTQRYYNLHPFHKRLHSGQCTYEQVQAWALNRYCYQEAMPRKDAAFMSRLTDRTLRREWMRRLLDHDGYGKEPGGVERWLLLTDGLGFSRDYVASRRGALPNVKFAIEASVRFMTEQPLIAAIATSLTELFAPAIHRERISGMLENYDFIEEHALVYFKQRIVQAPHDADFVLDYVKRHTRNRQEQEACIDAVRFKCDVLWAQLDAIWGAYIEGEVPPGAWRPGQGQNPVYVRPHHL